MRPARRKLPARSQCDRGFSLVETVIAVGIFAFAIVAIFGLLTAALRSNKDAASDTALAQMAETAVNVLRTQPFASFATNTAYSANNTSASYYFDIAGQLARTSSNTPATAPQSDSLYSCSVQRMSTSSTNFYQIRLIFKWPISAASTNQKTSIINASVANYD